MAEKLLSGSHQVKIGNYLLGDTLGSGTFGKVKGLYQRRIWFLNVLLGCGIFCAVTRSKICYKTYSLVIQCYQGPLVLQITSTVLAKPVHMWQLRQAMLVTARMPNHRPVTHLWRICW